jgi:hypothetical protein
MPDKITEHPVGKPVWYGILFKRMGRGEVLGYTSSCGVACDGRLEALHEGIHPDLVEICRFTLPNDTEESCPIKALKEMLKGEVQKLGINYVEDLDPNPEPPYNYKYGRYMEQRAKVRRENPKPWTIFRI